LWSRRRLVARLTAFAGFALDVAGSAVLLLGFARLLKPFGIGGNKTVRMGSQTAKGYHRHQFEEAWQRYLMHEGGQGAQQPSQRHNPDGMGTSDRSPTVTEKSDVTIQKCDKPPSNGDCDDVTIQNGGIGGLARVRVAKAKNAHSAAKMARSWLPHGFTVGLAKTQASLSSSADQGGIHAAWMAACDADDLTIPPELDRRGEATLVLVMSSMSTPARGSC
jgi:hypothetical protein